MSDPTPAALFKSGDLDAALAKATADVKAKPTDPGPRSMLGMLLLASGDLERADKMFDAVSNLRPESAVWSGVQRGLIRGETARREVFGDGRPPKLMADPSGAIKLRLEALLSLREGDEAAAAKKLEEANEASFTVHAAASCERAGDCSGERFRDMDDLLGQTLEIVTASGEYYWIEPSSLASITFSPPETIVDVLYRPATMLGVDGQEGAVYLPTVYAGSEDPACRMAQATKWVGETVVRGRGQREFVIGGEPRAALEIDSLTFGKDE